jgi:hypothetical protein
MPTNYSVYDVQIADLNRGQNIGGGGSCLVIAAGLTNKVTLYDPDNNYAALTQPVVPKNGKIRFATVSTVTSVDLYGMDSVGRFFVRRGMYPGAESEAFIIGDDYEQNAIVPFDPADYTAGTELQTGFVFPIGSLIRPAISMTVTALHAAKTINVGLLSSESGGSASGLINGLSLATVGAIKPTAAATMGSFLIETIATTPAVNLPVPKAIAVGAAQTLTLTTSSATTTAKGFLQIPYVRPIP